MVCKNERGLTKFSTGIRIFEANMLSIKKGLTLIPIFCNI